MTNINDLLKGLQEFKPDSDLLAEENHGGRSTIYRVSKNEVAKIPNWIMRNYLERPTCSKVEELLGILSKEEEIARYLSSQGINVPEQKGLFFIDIEGAKIPGLVMERIPGRSMYSIYSYDCEEKIKTIEKIWKDELKKLNVLRRIIPCDEQHSGNAVYNPTNQKVYLIDFELWSFQ